MEKNKKGSIMEKKQKGVLLYETPCILHQAH